MDTQVTQASQASLDLVVSVVSLDIAGSQVLLVTVGSVGLVGILDSQEVVSVAIRASVVYPVTPDLVDHQDTQAFVAYPATLVSVVVV